jgi:hypothetical protein
MIEITINGLVSDNGKMDKLSMDIITTNLRDELIKLIKDKYGGEWECKIIW